MCSFPFKKSHFYRFCFNSSIKSHSWSFLIFLFYTIKDMISTNFHDIYQLPLNSPFIFTSENYHIWLVKMQGFLEAYDLWRTVVEDKLIISLLTNPTIVKQLKAKSLIQNYVADCLFYIACQTSKEVWHILEEEYEGSDKIRQMQVLILKWGEWNN